MGRKIEFFIDNDNGNVKIKDYLKRRGVSHLSLIHISEPTRH